MNQLITSLRPYFLICKLKKMMSVVYSIGRFSEFKKQYTKLFKTL